jgi:hypothetical protein
MLLLVLVHLLAIQDDDQLHLALWFRPDIKQHGGLALHHGGAHHHHHHQLDGVGPEGGTIFFWAHTNDIR